MPVNRVYLVGFMGAGKTSTGRALSRQLGWLLIDLDSEIERSEAMTVQEIFRRFGEPHLRQLEREHLERASRQGNAVIALGGGAYVDPRNRGIADATGLTVWLNASFSTIQRRVKMDGSRPLFGDNERAERLFQERLPAYEKAMLHVFVDDKPADAAAAEIVGRMEHPYQ